MMQKVRAQLNEICGNCINYELGDCLVEDCDFELSIELEAELKEADEAIELQKAIKSAFKNGELYVDIPDNETLRIHDIAHLKDWYERYVKERVKC